MQKHNKTKERKGKNKATPKGVIYSVVPFLFIFVLSFLFLLPFSSAQGLISSTNEFTTYTGNLTNLHQLNDTNIVTPTNLQLLQFQTSDNKWHPYSFVLGNFWDYDYADLINEPTALSDFSDDLGDRGYTSVSNFTNDFSYYNSTSLQNNSQLTNDNNYWNDTYATFNKTYADTLYYDLANSFGYYNSTNPSPVINTSYYLATNPFSFYNSTDFSISNYYELSNPFGYYNSTDFVISDYATNTKVDSLGNFSAYDQPTHLTNFTNNLGIGNWTLDKPNYYTKTEVTTNISTANTSLVNWVEGNYYTSTETDTEITNANTSISTWSDSKFVVNSGGDNLTGQYNFNGAWQDGGASVINGDGYFQNVYAYNFSGLDITNLNTNGSLYPTIDNTFDLGNQTFRWNDLNLGGNALIEGNLGIGTTSPTYKLDIDETTSGNLLVARFKHAQSGVIPSILLENRAGAVNSGFDINFGLNSNGNQGKIGVVRTDLPAAGGSNMFFSTSYGEVMRLDGSGNVGIGTTVPKNKLDVEGGMVIGATYSGTNTAPSNGLLIQGNVGIGTTSPNESLEVNGNVWADNFYVTSDRDLKTNIEVIESSSFGNLYKYKLNKSKDVYEEINKTKEKEVCEEFLITNSSEICELDKKTNETSCSEVPAIYEKQCHNETEIYTETKKVGVEYYDSEEYIGLMTDELNEDFVKTTDGVSRVNLYGLISKIWVLLGGHDDRITELENENTLIKSELCKKDNTYSWCLGAIK